jgi:Protein of unknown function (DUF4235)
MAKPQAKKGGSRSRQLAVAVATSAAVFVVRKLLTAGWTRATGKTPPDPADPQVRIAEALGWAVIAGVTIEATKLFTARAAARRLPAPEDAADS